MKSTTRVRLTYYTLTGLFWFSTALIAPIYVLFFMNRGMNLSQIALWGGFNAVAVMLLEIPTGGLADSWGRGRTFSLANGVIASSMALMLLAKALPLYFAGAFLFGSGRALSSGSLDAWFVDALKEADPNIDIEKDLGRSGAVILALLALGSLLGSFLPSWAEHLRLPGTLSPMSLPLVADLLLKILLAGLTLVLVKDPNQHASAWKALAKGLGSTRTVMATALTTIKANRILPWLFVGAMALALGVGSVESFWQPRFQNVAGIDGVSWAFGGIMAGCFFVGAVMSLLAPLVTKLFRGHRAFAAACGTLMMAGALVLLASAQKPVEVALGMFAVYGFVELAGVPRKAMINDTVPPKARATLLSVDSFLSYAGFLGVVALGFLADQYGIPLAWTIASGGTAVLALAYIPLRKGERYAAKENPGRVPS